MQMFGKLEVLVCDAWFEYQDILFMSSLCYYVLSP